MKTNQIKLIVIALIAIPMLVLASFNINSASAYTKVDEETAASYKKNCAACHSPKAEKFYNPEMPIEQQVEVILKGKKGEKPPYMPGYETKGITADQAKALAEYMKGLRAPSN